MDSPFCENAGMESTLDRVGLHSLRTSDLPKVRWFNKVLRKALN